MDSCLFTFAMQIGYLPALLKSAVSQSSFVPHGRINKRNVVTLFGVDLFVAYSP